MTGALLDIDIRVEQGPSLREHWANGPTTYLGIFIAGFPNLFMITGPESPPVKSNMIAAIEQHLDWIHGLLARIQSAGVNTVEATPEAESAWVNHVNEIANGTLYPLTNSWYTGSNIPGKPKVFMPYVAGLDKYRDHCAQLAREAYQGLKFSSPSAVKH
jgi:cyclohexanone monooxygenase